MDKITKVYCVKHYKDDGIDSQEMPRNPRTVAYMIRDAELAECIKQSEEVRRTKHKSHLPDREYVSVTEMDALVSADGLSYRKVEESNKFDQVPGSFLANMPNDRIKELRIKISQGKPLTKEELDYFAANYSKC